MSKTCAICGVFHRLSDLERSAYRIELDPLPVYGERFVTKILGVTLGLNQRV